MVHHSKELEQQFALQTAAAMCTAARTAPKGHGKDTIHTLVLTGEDKERLAEKMEEVGKRMMGEKWHAFVLQLSFIGWLILCSFTFGIGLFFLEPYYQATMAELYAALRSKAFAMNLTDASELGGFVRH